MRNLPFTSEKGRERSSNSRDEPTIDHAHARSTDPSLVCQPCCAYLSQRRKEDSSNNHSCVRRFVARARSNDPQFILETTILTIGESMKANSSRHDVSEDLPRAQEAPVLLSFFKSALIDQEEGGRVQEAMVCPTLGRARTQHTLISRSFQATAIYKSRRGREQSLNSHDVSDDLWRSQEAPILLSFFKPAFCRSGRGREHSSNSYAVSHAWSRTRKTPIPLSFYTPAIFRPERGRGQSSNSHDVSDDLLPIAPLFHKPAFFVVGEGQRAKFEHPWRV